MGKGQAAGGELALRPPAACEGGPIPSYDISTSGLNLARCTFCPSRRAWQPVCASLSIFGLNRSICSGILGGPINMPRHFRRTDQHVLPFRPSGHEVHCAQVTRTGTSVMVFVLYTRSHFRSESINMLQQIVYKEHFRNESINMLGYFRFRIPINIPLVTHTM